MAALRPGRLPASARVIAERLGVSQSTVKRLFAEPLEEYESLIEARHERIRELRANGLSYHAIAAELDVSISTVYYALNKHKTAT
jgi:transposase